MIQAIAPWPPTIPTILASAQRLTEDIAEDDPPESDLATLWDIDTDAADSDDVTTPTTASSKRRIRTKRTRRA